MRVFIHRSQGLGFFFVGSEDEGRGWCFWHFERQEHLDNLVFFGIEVVEKILISVGVV